MNDVLRTFRLGTINLMGVTIPGLVFLFIIGFGCIAPCIYGMDCWLQTNLTLTEIPPLGKMDVRAVVAMMFILAYVIGYIFRLSTPDVLDKKSADLVLKNMRRVGGQDAPKTDHWPYRGEPGNKFPYFHFRDYLEHRKHKELAARVEWDSKVRSKTFVNKMKFETALRSQTLSAFLDSNEAHVRLMFGTWLACRLALPFVIIGWIVTMVAICSVGSPDATLMKGMVSRPGLPYWLILTSFLIVGSWSAIFRIENLFHYRRVRELFDIVECYHLAMDGFELDGSMKISGGKSKVAIGK